MCVCVCCILSVRVQFVNIFCVQSEEDGKGVTEAAVKEFCNAVKRGKIEVACSSVFYIHTLCNDYSPCFFSLSLTASWWREVARIHHLFCKVFSSLPCVCHVLFHSLVLQWWTRLYAIYQVNTSRMYSSIGERERCYCLASA